MPWKLIYLDRRDNSYDKVGGLCTFLCDDAGEIDNLPKGLPDEDSTYSPLPGSIAITLDPPSVWLLDLNNTWGEFSVGGGGSGGGTSIPDPPTTDGTYTLKCTVSSGVATYTWE